MDRARSLVDELALKLLRRIAEGDESAFVELFRTINRRTFQFARHLLDNEQDAEEVLHDTAMELWRRPEGFRGESRFMTYVLGIAHNKALGMLRARGRREAQAQDDLDEVADDDGSTPFEIVCTKESFAAVARCMDRLSNRQRVIVHLAYFEDLSREEIGRIIGCTGNAVRQHLMHALRKLKACLAEPRSK
jgi:RNA polymerase sigma-70 factor (ECF subfamily)